jgi:diguanylate cyclase (GGDEF)-like protein/putative nucleotidyltransferase with HDIG domain
LRQYFSVRFRMIIVNIFNLTEFNTKTKIIWFAVVILAVACFLLSAFGLFSLDLSQITYLIVAAFVFFVLCQMQIKIPNTKLTFWFREVGVLSGAICFGVSGAVILAIVGSIAAWYFHKTSLKNRIFLMAANIVAAFTATKVFYFLIQLFGFNENIVAQNPIATVYLIAGLGAMVLTYYLVNSVLVAIFFSVVSENRLFTKVKTDIKLQFVSYLGGAVLAYFSYLCLQYFGMEFVLVFVPVSLVTYLTYYFQAQTLSEKTKEIREAGRIHLATVEALATAIDARDQMGEGHARRVQILAVGVGNVLGLSHDEISALRTGALLHDIGKLAIPDHILNKSGKLSPAEMEKMKIHPNVGASILEKIDFSYPVVPTVRFHHENWDGTGYPQKLSGEKIPITARILAVADTYDSVRGERAYSKPHSKEDARNILRDSAGKKFDPKIVDVFLRNLHNLEAELNAQGLDYEEISQHDTEASFNDQNSIKIKTGYVQQIKNANKEVFTLYELARVFSASLNLQETLQLFTEKLGELIPFETCAVYILDESNNFAVAKHVEGQNDQIIKGRKIRINEGATGSVLENRTPVYQVSPALDLAFYDTDIASYYVSMASLPLLAENRLVGAISLYSAELVNYEEEHMRLLETVSKIAADAIAKSISHAETENRSLTDPMTGLPNARSLQTQFEVEVARAYRSNTEFQVMMIDLDGFKKVNDTFGHKIGDAVLREVSKVMRSQLREYDFLARYAGDEFVAILPQTNTDEIHELIQRIQNSVKSFALPVDEVNFAKVGASIGFASYPNNGLTLDQVLIVADGEMYAAKALNKEKEELANPKPLPRPEPDFKPISVDENMLIVELDESHIVSNSMH